jgi:putative restriction endonuclease
MLERSLQYPYGRIDVARAARRVRLMADNDFFRILDIVDPESKTASPSISAPSYQALREERQFFPITTDRVTTLMSRQVRDRQFRTRVMKIYNSRCAVSGSALVDIHGNPEVQAAHLMSVKARGPDCLTNGVALSSSLH